MGNSSQADSQVVNQGDRSEHSAKRFRIALPSWIVVAVIVIVAPIPDGGDARLADSYLWTVVPAKVGTLLGAVLICGIASFVTWLVFRRSQLAATLVFCSLGVLMVIGLLAARFDDAQDARTTVTPGAGTERYTYHPANSEYRVAFESAPVVEAFHIPFGDTTIRGERAEVRLGREGFLRAEFIPFPASHLATIDEGTAIEQLRQYAEFNGVLFPEFEFREVDLGRVAQLRGTKNLQDESRQIHSITYVMHAYYGDSSALLLYVGAPREAFPTPPVSRFLRSVRKAD